MTTDTDRTLATFAQMRLERLCDAPEPVRNEGTFACASCGFEVLPTPSGWVHNSAEVAAMRRIVESAR